MRFHWTRMTLKNLMIHRWLASCLWFLLMMCLGAAEVLAQSGGGQAASGLKEALTTGTANAINLIGRPGGYFSNPAIKIGFPKNLGLVETGLRRVGYGPQIDKFIRSMNSAAESAAPKAKPIFIDAIENMGFSDAQRIVTQGGHSATDYFQKKTTPELTAAFTPVVEQEMAKYSVTKQYDALIGHYQSGTIGNLSSILGGGATKPSLDINGYVVSKALDGLFYEVGQQEEKIRTNPVARVTPLLKSVFGNGR
jgi:uncharacterized protein DUF4197